MVLDRFGARALLLAAALFLLNSLPSAAKTADPNPADNPILAKFLQEGAKIYFMGAHDGLNGWFITKDQQVQMGYTTADNKNIVMGVLFDEKADNYSVTQFRDLYNSNKEINTFFNNLDIGALANAVPNVPNLPAANGSTSSVAPLASMPIMASIKQVAPQTDKPGERLIHELDQAAGVVLGPPSAPQLFMVMNPNCPHCQATWSIMRDAVMKGSLQVHMIPIGQNDEDNRAAARLLQASDPLTAWDKYAAGDKSQLAGPAEPLHLAAIRANHILIDNWHIQFTPYFVYRAKEGQVKIVQGEPDQLSAVLNDLAP
jgi:protein-disulfide isomerase